MAVISWRNKYEILIDPLENGLRVGLGFSGKGAVLPSEWLRILGNLPEATKRKVLILLQWLEEEIAMEDGDAILLSPQATADLPKEDRLFLDLPDLYPYGIEIEASGTLADQTFRYQYGYVRSPGRPMVLPRRLGAWLSVTSEEAYLLNAAQLALVEAIDRYNETPPEERTLGQNLLRFAEIKPLAAEVRARLDHYLKNEDVAISRKVQVRLAREGDGLEVIPELEGLSEEEAEEFRRRYDCQSDVPEKYDFQLPGGGRRRVVPDEKTLEGLRQIKRIRHLSGERAKEFASAPQSLLDPDVVDLTQFGLRVKGIGLYKPTVTPFLRESKSWLPPEDIPPPDDQPGVKRRTGGLRIKHPDGTIEEIRFQSSVELVAFWKKLNDAQKADKPSLECQGVSIPVTDETMAAIRAIRREFDQTGEDDEDPPTKDDQTVLIIYENIDEFDELYEEGNGLPRIPRHEPPRVPCSLSSTVTLLDHQREGIAWLQFLKKGGFSGGLLADDMGLGKTLQALAFLATEREEGGKKSSPILIVTPMTVVDIWMEEYDRFFQPPILSPILPLYGRQIAEYRSSEPTKEHRRGTLDIEKIRSFPAVLTTYETVRDFQLDLAKIPWKTIVLDETQRIKTPGH